MSDEARPARKRRLQVHLSTAVVMMVVAIALLWANFRASADGEWYRFLGTHLISRTEVMESVSVSLYGWPFFAVCIYQDSHKTPARYKSVTDVFGVCVDAVVAVAILWYVWFVWEGWIRRRAAKKGTGTASAER